jgi:putative transposase
MARLPRLSIGGYPHHAVQRGHNRQAIFADGSDFSRYLEALSEVMADHQIAIHAYVLMPNHVHLVLTPPDARAIGSAMQAVGRRYVRWFNDRHRRSGALFEGRYRSTVIEADRYLLACMRYVELNPVRAALVSAPEQYVWSSYRHHSGLLTDPLIHDHAIYWQLGNTPFDRQSRYCQIFEAEPVASEIDLIRQSTRGGWALGTRDFAARLGRISVRRSEPRPPGRPPAHSVPS